MAHLIILHIIEGKYFPMKGELAAECIFNNITQNTDTISENATPFWNHEFKWELSRRRLMNFRAARLPVKINFFVKDDRGKQLLGYLIFSLRDGTSENTQWHQLLNSKFPAPPVVKILFRISDKESYEEEMNERKRQAALERRRKEIREKLNHPEFTIIEEKEPKKLELKEKSASSDDYSSDFEVDDTPETQQEIERINELPLQISKDPELVLAKPDPNLKEMKENSLLRDSEEEPLFVVDEQKQEGSENGTILEKHDSQVFHFRVGIDIKEIRSMSGNYRGGIYLRYQYPLFGNISPTYTFPPVVAVKSPQSEQGASKLTPEEFAALGPQPEREKYSSEIVIPVQNGFSLFELALEESEFYSQLRSVPLPVEVMEAGSSEQQYDCQIGYVSVNFSNTLLQSPITTLASTKLRVWDGWFDIHSTNISPNSQPIGIIRMIITVEDLGPVKQALHRLTLQGSNLALMDTSLHQSHSSSESGEMPKTITKKEWNQWKKEQHNRWRGDWKEKEKKLIENLENDYKSRTDLKEKQFVIKYEEIERLEKKLLNMIHHVEKREIEINGLANELENKGANMKREYSLKVEQLEEIVGRAKRELAAQKQVEKMRIEELERQKNHLDQKLLESERKFRVLEDEFSQFKTKLPPSPDRELQLQLLNLVNQKTVLEKKLEGTKKKKRGLREQLQKLQKDHDQLQHQVQIENESRLKKEQKELETLRNKYLSREMTELNKHDKQDLENLKLELQTFKLREELNHMHHSVGQVAATLPSSTQFHTTTTMNTGILNKPIDNEKMFQVEQLNKERESLLKTGLYNERDKLIQQIDTEISRLRSQ
jgi:hypothetical protein